MPFDDNNHVTLALVAQKQDHMTCMLAEHIARTERWQHEYEERLRAVETQMTKLDERQTSTARGQTIYASVASIISGAIAALVGRSQ